MSCAVFTGVGVYAAATGKPNTWIVGMTAVLAVVFILVAAFLAWKEQYERAAEERRPKFILEGGPIVAHCEAGRTLVFLGMRIVNAGADSSVLGYEAKYRSVVGTDEMKIAFIKNDPLRITMPNGAVFAFRGRDAINQRTHIPIPRGGYIAGRLPLVIDGNKVSDITNGFSAIEVTVQDYLGTRYSLEFRGQGMQELPMYMAGEPIAPGQVGMQPPISNDRAGKNKSKKSNRGKNQRWR